jgi:DNA-binding LacI/PurR family transcriptional regulator
MAVKERITLKDVADHVGVTPIVVSHVLNGVKGGNIRVSHDRRNEILKASQELGYVPHFYARQMAKRRSFTIGVVLMMHPESIPKDLSPFVVDYAHETILGVESVCSENNYNCLINVQRVDKAFKLPRMMSDGSVDGVAIVGPSNEEILKQFSRARITCVQVGSNVPRNMGIKFVAADAKKKFREVSEACFRQHGLSRQMACMKEGPGPEEIMEHFVALRDRTPGLRNERVVLPACWEEQHNRDIFRGILTRPNRPEVLFIEATYIGALLDVVGELGLKVPDDLNVITYGVESLHKRLESVFSRSFAMITFSAEEVGRLAARLLLKKFGDYEKEIPSSTECDFVNGQTCKELDLDLNTK